MPLFQRMEKINRRANVFASRLKIERKILSDLHKKLFTNFTAQKILLSAFNFFQFYTIDSHPRIIPKVFYPLVQLQLNKI